jgi:hypothetical protein
LIYGITPVPRRQQQAQQHATTRGTDHAIHMTQALIDWLMSLIDI